MDGSVKALMIGGAIFAALLFAIGIGINLGQAGPATANADGTPVQTFADLQREQMQMARDAMEQARQMQQFHMDQRRMVEEEMMGIYEQDLQDVGYGEYR